MLRHAFGKGVLVAIAASTLLVVGCSFVLTFDESQIPSEATDGGAETSAADSESDSATDSVVADSNEIDSGETDSGTDSGTADSPTPDVATDVPVDSGSAVDSGSDSGSAATDSGADTAMMDMGTTDTADAFMATPSTFAGCTAGDYAANDFTGDSAVAEIQFPSGGFQYTPKCIRVKAGQSVKWTAASGVTFANHPLRHAPGNPDGSKIPDQDTGTTFTETFTVTGFYGYYCNFHGSPTSTGGDMSGTIEVVP